MKSEIKQKVIAAMGFLTAFALWTAVVSLVDVRAIGPNGSSIGLAQLNGQVHRLTGVNMTLYRLTDGLSLVPVGLMLGFACLGMWQWVKRRSLFAVDRSIVALGVFYIVVLAAYAAFEVFVVNERPVLIEGVLEASYPSSTTLLVLCVMPTAMMQFKTRIRSAKLRWLTLAIMAVFTVLMVVLRLVSGVHWLSDIVGGVLLSAGLVLLYSAFADTNEA